MTYELTAEDRRSLALHRALVPHLLADPERVFAIARDNIARWTPNYRPGGSEVQYLREWEALMDEGVDAVVEMLTSEGERACTLRPASPFAGVISQKERLEVLEQWKAERGRP